MAVEFSLVCVVLYKFVENLFSPYVSGEVHNEMKYCGKAN